MDAKTFFTKVVLMRKAQKYGAQNEAYKTIY